MGKKGNEKGAIFKNQNNNIHGTKTMAVIHCVGGGGLQRRRNSYRLCFMGYLDISMFRAFIFFLVTSSFFFPAQYVVCRYVKLSNKNMAK